MREDLGSISLVGADKVESTSSLTIETHDLGERLGNDHLETLSKEKSEAHSIFIEISANETLVSGIKEWIKLSFSANLSDDFPLIKSWVDTSWIMCASMEENA